MEEHNSRERLISIETQRSDIKEITMPFLDRRKISSIAKRHKIKELTEKKFVLSRAMLIFSVIILFLEVTYNENAESLDPESMLSFTLLDFVSVLTIINFFCKIQAMFYKITICKIERLIPYSAKFEWHLVFRLITYSIHPNRFAEGIYIESYASFPPERFERKLNEYLLVFQATILFYDIYKRALFLNNLTDHEVELKIKKARVRHSLIFYMKYIFLKNPVAFVIKLIVISSIYFSLMLKIFESPIDIRDHSNLIYWSNSIWTTFVTALTIGYGDCFPRTYFGRVISIATGIFGYVIFSLLVISIVSMKDFDAVERKLFNSIDIKTLRSKLQISAERLIKEFILCHRDWKRKDGKAYVSRRLSLEHKAINFKVARIEYLKALIYNSTGNVIYQRLPEAPRTTSLSNPGINA